ncbi:hypothetical protein Micbo1qcDRAFT_138668 [Microdochium bolleyi]|uniref:F-box domain-containing protein n=1 Tax=Microdochium bolleyi TaxID=196109 RepID=A0A136IU08_9PEZI|nr:hypothetical protein Micbo1qcDRAFT_138668 [Microdochium bolleyi]
MDHGEEPAWECRDGFEQAEAYYNQPLRARNRELQDENLALKRLLRENGISWLPQDARPVRRRSSTRSGTSGHIPITSLPRLPVEVQLKILSFAVTSPHPIINPLCKVTTTEHLTTQEKAQGNQISIHFLATCKAYHSEGIKLLWTNNDFLFTSPLALKNFTEVPSQFRHQIKSITLRIVARYYDDEERTHRLPASYHPDFKKPWKLRVQMRPKEPTMARRGFRTYAWLQLIDFLEALRPPYQEPSSSLGNKDAAKTTRRSQIEAMKLTVQPRLFPELERIRIDFVDFGEDLLHYPPTQLHDLACHQLGRTLNELVLTGLPGDEAGLRASHELAGMLRDEGLLIDHAPLMASQRHGIRPLPCDEEKCHYSSRVVRAMTDGTHYHDHHDHHDYNAEDFPRAPAEVGEPPEHAAFSCRTMWKRKPIKLDVPAEREWELYDRISGLPWEEIEEEATIFDDMASDGEGMICENCGETHPGAIPPEDLMDTLDDL